MKSLRLIGRRFLAAGSFLDFERLHYAASDGRHAAREIVHHPGAVAVVPVLGDEVILIAQDRIPVGDRLLEIPAGKRDKTDEPLEVTAIRECEEEIGFRPRRLTPLGSFYTTPGFSDERIWLFKGEDLEAVPVRPQGPEEEMAEIVRLPISEALRRVDDGEILDVKTLIGLHSLRREFRP
ncbi:MAG: NUDIX hydrolase [Actinobacteria bacterium]|nr:NUDIX hydrolase [Actinomycetota bacterium]